MRAGVVSGKRLSAAALSSGALALITSAPGVAILSAAISIAISGHESGAGNNIFHMPILERLYDEPQFKNDQFIQSLRWYSSGYWMLFRGALGDADLLSYFVVLQIVSRSLFFFGVWLMAEPLRIEGRVERLVFVVLTSISAVLRNHSFAGDGGLLINSVTHSELANGASVIALALAARARFNWAVVAIAATAFLNLFMAVWLAPAVCGVALFYVRRGRCSASAIVKQCLPVIPVALLILTPVAYNIIENPYIHQPIQFSYEAFLKEFWPYHFLVSETPPSEILMLAAISLSGVLAASKLKQDASAILHIYMASFALLWMTGAVLPFLTDSVLILNLHLLRTSAMMQIIAAIAVSAYCTQLLMSADPRERYVWGPATLVFQSSTPKAIWGVLAVTISHRRWSPPRWAAGRWLLYVALAFVSAAILLTAFRAARADRAFYARQAHWIAMAAWVRNSTPRDSTTLIPTSNVKGRGPLVIGPRDQSDLAIGSEVFSTLSHRPVWVTGKQGAAVMWAPAYYATWRTRISDTLSLRSLSDRLAYARAHGIATVIDECSSDAPVPAAFRSGRLCAYVAFARM